ncbi:short chain dehydrogenase [Putridiphycobacter roseus]|uniref:Short chain dehydrogenase n=1 Tax=Putridiphycobacter roseus TaxID=2219161 RepID=A0A2W1ND72_9FLAO|nr:SDR family oxidoreductase [Putridiphycobacter roseus]PZE16026.1 short chain dehydrogenase [Putridiphycobacter roseus]
MNNKKIVWITGASSGIGKAIAKLYNEKGDFVILSSRNQESLEKVQAELTNPKESFIQPLDLVQIDTFDGIVKSLIDAFGRIDILVNNGGISQRSTVAETPLSIDRKIMEVNYFGNIGLTKALLPYLQAQKSGHIVVISSIAGKFGFYLRSAYAASKHALQGFYESLLLEEAKNNIFVTIVYPGKINTPISLSAINAAGEAHGVMDHNQETGMPASTCANIIIKAVEKKKKSILVGNKEIKAVYLKRFIPALFWRVIKNQKPT